MKINVTIDSTNLKARTLKEQKNLAYSASQALNATAKEIQQATRIHMDRTFYLRKSGFMYRMVKIFRFSNAKQGIPYAEVGIDHKPRLLLSMFEGGGRREPFKGKRVAVPITGGAARPGKQSIITEELTFRKMRFKKHRTKEGKVQWKGQSRTFLIPEVGVFQRTSQSTKTGSRGRKSFLGRGGKLLRESKMVRLLYKLYEPDQIKQIPANLRFMKTASEKMTHFFDTKFRELFNRYKK